MNKLPLFFAATFLTLTFSGQQRADSREPISKGSRESQVTSSSDDPGLRRIADDWRDAYNGKDAAKLAALYTDDAYYISSHVPGLVAHGREEIRVNFERGIDAGGHVDSIRIMAGETSCDMAYSVCSYEATNAGQKVSGRNLLVLKRVRGMWQIASQVSVVPDNRK